MTIRHALYGCALLLASCTGALAQEDPEAVYGKLHRAMLAGKVDEMMGYVAASTKAELAAKPQAEREAMVRGMAQALPKAYTITEKSVAADGNSAELRATGASEFQGRGESYLTASFRKEGDAWKASTWSWSNRKPPPIPKPAAPVVATAPASNVADAPQQVVITRKAVPLPAGAPVRPEVAPNPAVAAKRPSRAHLDARACLKLPNDKAIMTCAERYR